MNIIKPEKLKIGDTIGILATSGAIEFCENVLRAKTFFENLGYNVILSENTFDKKRYLAGDDSKKVEELHRFFADGSVNAIICMRGGYGAIRLIKSIDYDLIKNNPKIFCGYSDITALSLMILAKSNLMTYSGPLAQSDFGLEVVNHNTVDSFFNVINNNEFIYHADYVYKSGSASGILWGGNLSTVVSLCGQDFIPNEKFVFFTEDLNEPAYKIDKMFTQLLNIDNFRENIAGIVLGDFINLDNKQWFDEIIVEIANNLDIPVCSGFKITHNPEKITLPYGAMATINNDKLKIIK